MSRLVVVLVAALLAGVLASQLGLSYPLVMLVATLAAVIVGAGLTLSRVPRRA